jgi:hypothetical protein
VKQRDPAFWDYPDIWGAIAAVAVASLILVAVAFGRHPAFVDVAYAVSGSYLLAWLFALARYALVFR